MGRRRVKCKRGREVVDQRSGLRDVAGPVPPLPTVMYLVRVMLLGILSVRTIKEHTEMPVVKRFFFLSGEKMVREKYGATCSTKENASRATRPLVAREKTRTEVEN